MPKQLEWEHGEARSSLGTLYYVVSLSPNVWSLAINGTRMSGWFASRASAQEAAQAHYEAQLPARLADDDPVLNLFLDAYAEAEKAMRKFPQPNYVISKVAEEAGEVVKAAIHCAEGRDTSEHVVEEIRQAMAMLIRLYIEGDQVHGLAPLMKGLANDQ